MTTALYIILAILGIIVILSVIAPKNFDVNRSIIIDKPLTTVFDYLKLIKNQDNWSPWGEKDPNMKKTFSGTDGEVGFISAWVGNKQVGEGEQEITGIEENKAVYSELRFFKPWKSVANAYIKVEKAGKGTKVIWGFSGKNKFPFNIVMLFMNMDKAMGKEFEFGLNKLKGVLEV